MPGFFVSNDKINLDLKNIYQEKCFAESIESKYFTIKRNTLNKFMDDKAFKETENAIIVLDGYLLNKALLFQKYDAKTVVSLIWNMYEEVGECFFNEFRGSFAGALYDKARDKWLIYTNHTGDNPIFYTSNGAKVVAGSQVNYVIESCRKSNIELTFNENAAYQMMTYGFMVDDSTYANEIKRLRGGMYLCVENDRVEIKEYHVFKKGDSRFKGKTEKEIIDELDKAFRKVVQLEYDKDDEYGYEHLADISGGLDSRMDVWVAHELQPRHLQLLTYCKANYMDELIAKQIATFWKDEILVKSLDDGAFFYDIDDMVFLLGGLSWYSGITGGKRLLASLNIDRFGLEHTGMIGDVVIGSFYKNERYIKKELPLGMYSKKYISRVKEIVKDYHDTFQDHEIFLIYSRGLQGAANTFMLRRNFTEAVSPFMDVDFLELCLDIPVEMRMGHEIYKKWIISKYPKAAKYKWEKVDGKITDSKLYLGIKKIIKRGPNKMLKIIGRADLATAGMTPYDCWIANNEKLREYMDDYERDAYSFIPSHVSEDLISDMKNLYAHGNAMEKTMVLTVLGATKLYFSKEEV